MSWTLAITPMISPLALRRGAQTVWFHLVVGAGNVVGEIRGLGRSPPAQGLFQAFHDPGDGHKGKASSGCLPSTARLAGTPVKCSMNGFHTL